MSRELTPEDRAEQIEATLSAKTGSELKARRLALGLTQAQFADRLGCTQVDISRWESGAVKITAMRAAWIQQRLAPLEAAHAAT